MKSRRVHLCHIALRPDHSIVGMREVDRAGHDAPTFCSPPMVEGHTGMEKRFTLHGLLWLTHEWHRLPAPHGHTKHRLVLSAPVFPMLSILQGTVDTLDCRNDYTLVP